MAGKKTRRTAFVPRLLIKTAIVGVIPACAVLLHRCTIGRGEDLAELLVDLVGASQDSILREKPMKPNALVGSRSLSGFQEEPSATGADRAHLGARAKEHLATKLVERCPRAGTKAASGLQKRS